MTAENEMISFSLDPQWCGLLFSVCSRHEKGGFTLQDAFAFSVAGPPLDADLIAWAGTIGFEIWSLPESVKATGFLLVIGVGGLFCYKLLNLFWARARLTPNSSQDKGDGESLVKGEYFGPNTSSQESLLASPPPHNWEGNDTDSSSCHQKRALHSRRQSKYLSMGRESNPVPSQVGDTSHLPRDESYDSLGFSPQRRSFDSSSSDLSFDYSLPETVELEETNTLVSLEKLQQEIDSLKSNCLMMDEEFETIKCNRNFPGMSSLMKANTSHSSLSTQGSISDAESRDKLKQQKARACFAGLYSLTTIKNSTSSELSDSFPAPTQGRGSTGSAESLDWDSPTKYNEPVGNVIKFALENVKEVSEQSERRNDSKVSKQNINRKSKSHSHNLSEKSLAGSEDELMESLEWDEEDMVEYPVIESSIGQGENLQSSASPEILNIGPKVNVVQYAVSEWHGNTKRAETILQGYAEIPRLLNAVHMRRIRGDNYCGIRAAIFQTLAQGLPLPHGENTYNCLANAIANRGYSWLQDWSFAGRLPYHGSNVLHGMKTCLSTLDSVASFLSTSNNREETLANLLNSDPTVDLHLVEGVKLQMLSQAIALHDANITGQDVPLFAVLMFSRDTSESPRDLMNNHLHQVGNTSGLEQVEMFLLGYTLGVTLLVIRPSAYNTEDFICRYPDSNVGEWPQVALIAEDDRHYNVLVN